MSDQPSKIPTHIAVIMDGNGRWANERGLPRIEGHRRGADAAAEVTEGCIESGVGYLTLYAFSVENWQRPKHEVSALMDLLERFLKEKGDSMSEKNIRFRAIGRLQDLPKACRDQIDKLTARTASNTGLCLILALSYGSRTEILDAAAAVAREARAGKLDPDTLTPEMFSNHLYTAGIPDPDLLIRTSGELRLSNFLLWQMSYAEIYVTQTLWPDFGKPQLSEAVADYGRRHRRFGGL